MSNDPNSSAPAEAPAKPRNPVERILVWGLILVLVGVVGKEAFARFGYTNSLNSLQAALEADDDGDTLTIDEIAGHLSGSPTREEDQANRTISYHWSGLLKDYGSIHLKYSDDNEVLGLLTADAPPPEEIVILSSDDPEGEDAAPAADMAGGPGEGGPGGEGGRPRFDPMQFDADADGKISLEEAPERMKERFAEIDTNGDGFADQEEFAARRAARSREGGERPERPARPEETSDDSAPAEEKDAPPPAEAGDKGSSEESAAESSAEESSTEEN